MFDLFIKYYHVISHANKNASFSGCVIEIDRNSIDLDAKTLRFLRMGELYKNNWSSGAFGRFWEAGQQMINKSSILHHHAIIMLQQREMPWFEN